MCVFAGGAAYGRAAQTKSDAVQENHGGKRFPLFIHWTGWCCDRGA